MGIEPDAGHVVFNEDHAEFTRRDGTLTTTLDVLVSGEADAEVRRVSITNAGHRTREIDVTPMPNWCLRRRPTTSRTPPS